MKKFTQAEDDFLKANYLNIPAKRLSVLLGRPESSARQRILLLGLKVPAEIVAKFKIASQFKKGQTPKNKGKPMPKEMYQKCFATMFKKGQIPHNSKKDWEEVIRLDKTGKKYWMIKLPNERKLKYKHVWIWQTNKGKIKKGYNVVFKDGDSLNCNLKNLECISNAELMERNTIHRFPKELKQVIKLQNKIKRKINEQSKTST